MKINMQAALSSQDIIEAIADFVSEKTGSQVSINAVELDSDEHGIWAKVTVDADSDALTKPSKKKASAKRAAPKLESVKTEETSEVVEETETPEVCDTPQESDTADEAGPTAEETLSELKAAAAGKGNIFNRKTS